MPTAINVSAYSDALVVLGTAGILVPLVSRTGINPVLAYLGAGAALGPLGLGSLIDKFPLLYWVTVVNRHDVEGIADLGVVFLLFLVGLELSYRRLVAMRRLVLGLGLLQVLTTTVLIAGVGMAVGQPPGVSAILGAILSLSSTAIVLDILSRQGRLGTHTGRAGFSILLAQDLAVVPILMFVSLLGTQSSVSVWQGIAGALWRGSVALAAIVVIGRIFLRPLFRQVAAAQSSELFAAAVLFVIVASGLVAHQAGLSMALGAFVAGLLLAETEFRKAIEVTIEPFKGLLLGIFFFTVGMSIDVRELVWEPMPLAMSLAALLVLKFAVIMPLGRVFHLSWPVAIETSLLLAPGGEFAFVGIGLATSFNLLSGRTATFAIAVVSLSMVLTPVLAMAGRRLSARLHAAAPVDPALLARPNVDDSRAIVVGYGRVGKMVCSLLAEHHVPFIAVDGDPLLVSRERKITPDVYYGDATNEAFLKACGLLQASGLIITIDSRAAIDDIVGIARRLHPSLMIVARARDADHAQHLYAVGATTAVPETIEASFQLSEAALVGLGIPVGLAIAAIHERRDQLRNALQAAAQAAGKNAGRAVRQSRPVVL